MEKSRAIELLEHLAWDRDIERNPYGDALNMAIKALKAQLSQEGTTSDMISKFIDGLEETFAYIREREGGDSVCGLCEYDGAYIGQSGDWCNECPGFNRDDCFKLSDETRNKWTEEILKALPPAQPEQRYTEEELRVFQHGISLSLLSKRSAQHWQYDEDTATEIKFLERLYEKVGADMRGEQNE